MKMTKLIFLNLMTLAFTLESQADSLRRSDACAPTQEEKEKIIEKAKKREPLINQMAQRLFLYLEENALSVAIVSRVGGLTENREFRAPSKHPANSPFKGQKYTHAGIAYKNERGVWGFIHLLNESDCEGPTNQSNIYIQNLADFLRDDPELFDMIITIPSESLQEKILKSINNTSHNNNIGLPKSLHYPVYSNISYPFNFSSNRRQNSNQWVLTMIAASQNDAKTLDSAQRAYQENGFTPSEVEGGFLARIGRLFGALPKNVYLDDHTRNERRSGWYQFVSAASIYNYLDKTDRPVVSQKELCPILNSRETCNQKIKDILGE